MPQQTTVTEARPKASVGLWVAYGLTLALAVGGFFAAMNAYRGWIDRHQMNQPRYAAERALDALHAGNQDLARAEVKLLQTERPIGVTEGAIFTRQFSDITEGPVLRNRVQVYEQLAAELMKAHMVPEADAIAWKAILEYHIASRTLELNVPWNLLYHAKLAQSDWYAMFQALRVQAAMGVGDRGIPTPDRLGPAALPYDPELTKDLLSQTPARLPGVLVAAAEADSPREWADVANRLAEMVQSCAIPEMKQRMREWRFRALVASGQTAAAEAMLADLWGKPASTMDPFWQTWPQQSPVMNLLDRDPQLLTEYWLIRPERTRVSLPAFVDSFRVDARVQIDDLQGLKKFETGYFNRENDLMHLPVDDRVVFSQNVGASLSVKTDQPVYRIYLAYQASLALGMGPIVQLKIDDQAPIPLYFGSARPDLLAVDVNLEPGAHTFQFIYFNDSSFTWPPTELREDRNLTLFRMVMVHSKPK